jgi:threonine dehydratase
VHTPLVRLHVEDSPAEIWLKLENLQPIGSFKLRGAANAILSAPRSELANGVVTTSTGNMAQGVAWMARELGVPATILVPDNASQGKLAAVERLGGRIVRIPWEQWWGAVDADEERDLGEGVEGYFVHPVRDEPVMAGSGTIGLELVEQLPDVATVVIPVGGGGLASGIALALRAVKPDVKVVGVQAAACAPLAGGTELGYTIAEGIAVKQPGELTSRILDDHLESIVTVTDEEISEAIVLLMERAKLVVEGAGAAAVAALVAGRVPGDGPAVAILSGGNIDPTLLIQVMRHGLTLAGRYLVVRTRIPDRPGELIKLLSMFADEHANVVSVEHHREGMDVPVTETEVEATLLTRDQEHCTAILDALQERGYVVERLH